MIEWLAKYWAEAFFSAMLAALGWTAKKLWNRQKKVDAQQEAVRKGLLALLRGELVASYYHYIDRGWITLHGLESAEKMYAEYHNLGGDKTVTKLMEDLRELPVKDGNKNIT